MRRAFIAATILASSPLIAEGHPGHGHTNGTAALHYVAEPVHQVGLIAVCGVAALLFAIFRFANRHRSQEM